MPRRNGKPIADRSMPTFIAPQLCSSVERPPTGSEWIHEIKFDGYRIQMRVERGEVVLEDPQGPRLDAKVRRNRERPRSNYPIASWTGKSLRSTIRAHLISRALQAALSDGKSDDLIFFAFDLLFLKGDDFRAAKLVRPQSGS